MNVEVSLSTSPKAAKTRLLWWEEAGYELGVSKRNSLIADVTEDSRGQEYVLFTNGETLSLARAKSLGWERLKEFAEGKG